MDIVTNWSLQQNAFFTECATGTSSIILEAVAGAGKTTSILEAAINRIKGTVAILAYNKKIADEIAEKLKKRGVDWKKVESGTVHSFGLRAYRKQFPNLNVNGDKVSELYDLHFDREGEMKAFVSSIVKLVGLAKQRGFGLITSIQDYDAWMELIEHFDVIEVDEEKEESKKDLPYKDIIETAQKLLMISNRVTDIIDFDDMVYLPLIHNVEFWRYDAVFVDEAQDTNDARRLLVAALTKKGGRVIAVGDQKQAIYGFTGADNDSLDKIAMKHNAKRMPLSVSYRCAKKIVDYAKKWNPVITSAENAPDGVVEEIDMEMLFINKNLNAEAAILCRNTKPLVKLAFQLIRKKIACKVEGRDIGMGLKKLASRWSKIKTVNALEERLEEYLAKEKAKLDHNKKLAAKFQTIEDQVETLLVIIEQCRYEGKTLVTDMLAYIDSLFAENVKGVLTLSTIHKSKGREWPTVFWLDRAGTLPSKYAKQDWQLDQENNLCYVAATRAMTNLIEVKAK